ncbi:MAG: OmpA family protein [Lautropia sp.]
MTTTIRSLAASRADIGWPGAVAARVAPLVAAALLAACASTPDPNPRLEQARTALEQARADTARAELAPVEYNRAAAAVQRAERTWRAGGDRFEVDHQASVALRDVELATVSAQRKQVEQAIERASRERDAIQIDSSRRQAASAETQAAALAARNTALQDESAAAQRRADALAQRLQALEAKQTERGLVVTFSDVLFDVGQAVLRPAALSRIDQLAAVMKEYPERKVLIEGFTDSTGSASTNQDLSERRAIAVRRELVAQGIDPNRIVTRGHASKYPVAGNDTASGRQQNRRVEAVLSDGKGVLPYRD